MGGRYPIREYLNCNTDFCVYILKCPCTLVYVGKTIGPFKKRFQKHRSDIRVALTKTAKGEQVDFNKPVALHFVTVKHQIHELRGMVIEHVKAPYRGGDRNRALLCREAYWIHTLGTVQPGGLNANLSLTCFIDDR